MDTTTYRREACAVSIRAAAAGPDGALLEVTGLITRMRPQRTHRQDPWASVALADQSTQIDVWVFPILYPRVSAILEQADTATITGRLRRPADEPTAAIHAQQITSSPRRSQSRAVSATAARSCRVCGCTDDHACTPACWWVGYELCSACADGAR